MKLSKKDCETNYKNEFKHSWIYEESIKLPNGILRIGENLFRNCNVKNIIIPNSVKSICANSFNNCNIVHISIPNSVEIIDDSAFENCKCLKMINIPNNLEFLGNDVFKNCDNAIIEIDKNIYEKFKDKLTNIKQLKIFNNTMDYIKYMDILTQESKHIDKISDSDYLDLLTEKCAVIKQKSLKYGLECQHEMAKMYPEMTEIFVPTHRNHVKNLINRINNNSDILIETNKHPVVLSPYIYMTDDLMTQIKEHVKKHHIKFNEGVILDICGLSTNIYNFNFNVKRCLIKTNAFSKFDLLPSTLPEDDSDILCLRKSEILKLDKKYLVNPNLRPFGLKRFDSFINDFNLHNTDLINCVNKVLDIMVEYSKKIVAKYGEIVQHKSIILDYENDVPIYDIEDGFVSKSLSASCAIYDKASRLYDILIILLECCIDKVNNEIKFKNIGNNSEMYLDILTNIAIGFVYNTKEFDKCKSLNAHAYETLTELQYTKNELNALINK